MNLNIKKDEDDKLNNLNQDKTTIFQEARIFNQSPISPRNSRILLTKLSYLLLDDSFNRLESTNLFFSITKLFQNKDPALRQMVYLVVKQLSNQADDVLMATSSIIKDIQPNSNLIYRPNAIRTLAAITHPSMIQSFERFYKNAIVDRSPAISSSALVSSYHIHPQASDTINRWSNEVFDALSTNPSSTAQYHALGLLYNIRHKDRVAISKLIQSLTQSPSSLRNPLALSMLVRYSSRLINSDPNLSSSILPLLESWLRNKSDMVSIEAARAICQWNGATPVHLSRPVAVLQLALSTPNTPLKFAAIRTLNDLAQRHPLTVSSCNLEIENLITDSNRSIATFAITTLLKTGNEASVDRLMKQISSFMLEISDEFKVIVVDAVRTLCLKFPNKYPAMLAFLSQALRDEGGYDFKRAVVEAIIDMIKSIGESKEMALAHLCEFIEDCEFTKLSVRVLHLLGVEGPSTPEPTKYIRHIYNRVVLENAIVRAAAVSSLAKFGTNVAYAAQHVRRSVKVLLGRCLDDSDDEVRDRAAMYMRIIHDDELAKRTTHEEHTWSVGVLEKSLCTYTTEQNYEEPFNSAVIPRMPKDQIRLDTHVGRLGDLGEKQGESENSKNNKDNATAHSEELLLSHDAPASAATSAHNSHALSSTTNITSIPEFAGYGAPLHTSPPVHLTEEETEYVVSVQKHLFSEHVVFEYHVRNTVPEAVLDGVSVLMGLGDVGGSLREDFILPIDTLTVADGERSTYVSYSFIDDEGDGNGDNAGYPTGALSNTLTFTTKEVDPDSGMVEEEGYADEYQVDDVELGISDYVRPEWVSFDGDWEAMSMEHSEHSELRDSFTLSAMGSLQEATDALTALLGMMALGGSDVVGSAHLHTLRLSGCIIRGSAQGKVLAMARMAFEEGEGVNLEMVVRSPNSFTCELIMGAVQ
ncbi:hypothetical protein E3P89_02575 [Wallemia ichthyophaga]|uniref:Coatomer subunit gamma n=1 Tax=Wallemia ichthyophaga TaxID=245174 RepID=A0A4T0IEI9_WALIC|nr:hypothetical protein E3P93_02599 [Wallemia ichthyophaga]TIB17010.1 hypothetical protein E3P90_00197 [Wallemia ichthyophaga]TIB21530.1 hypothetical protein E3P89_02575 [Wallemia ichthyophaga]TIB27323.1 hypothetical protein E3P88_00197 [Wallemia ichthyophaga]